MPHIPEHILGQQTPEQRQAAFKAAGVTPITGETLVPAPDLDITTPETVEAGVVSDIPTTKTETQEALPPSPFEKRLGALSAAITGVTTFDETGGVVSATADIQKRISEIDKQNALLLSRQQRFEIQKKGALAKAEQRGVLQPFAAGEARRAQEVIQRENMQLTLDSLNLNIEKASLQGELTLAKQLAKEKANLEFRQKQNELDVTRANILANFDLFTPAEKRRANELLLRIDSESEFVAQQREEQEAIEDMVIDAIQKGLSPEAQRAARQARTREEAARIITDDIGIVPEKEPADITTFRAFFPDVDITTPEGRQQFLDFQRKQAEAVRKPEVVKAPVSRINEQGESIIGTSPPKSPTQGEQTDLVFFRRMNGAVDNMESLISARDIDLSALGTQFQLKADIPLLQSGAIQQFKQAMREFTEARLRKDSGAAIPPEEFRNDEKTYFPQPGDTKMTLEQKRKARLRALDALRVSSGNAYWDLFGENPIDFSQRQRAEELGKPVPKSDNQAQSILQNISAGTQTTTSQFLPEEQSVWDKITSFLGF